MNESLNEYECKGLNGLQRMNDTQKKEREINNSFLLRALMYSNTIERTQKKKKMLERAHRKRTNERPLPILPFGALFTDVVLSLSLPLLVVVFFSLSVVSHGLCELCTACCIYKGRWGKTDNLQLN